MISVLFGAKLEAFGVISSLEMRTMGQILIFASKNQISQLDFHYSTKFDQYTSLFSALSKPLNAIKSLKTA